MRRFVLGTLSTLLALLLLSGCNTTDKNPWQEQYDLGVRYLSEGNYEEAIIAFTAAIEIDPKKPNTYIGLYEAYIEISDYEAAEAIIEKAREMCGDLEYFNHLDLRGEINISRDGAATNISLKYSGLPSEVYVSRKNDGIDALIMAYFSDGQQIWRVWTEAHDSSGGDGGYMVSIPSEMTLSKLQRKYPWEPGTEFESISTTRNEETIAWNFTIPKSAPSISDIKYIGYYVYFYVSEEEYLAFANRGVANWEKAVFSIENGVQKYLGCTTIEEVLGLSP